MCVACQFNSLFPFIFPQFNKSTAVEAGLKFPENVTCNTINSVSLKGDLCDYERGSDGHLICTVKHLQEAITQKGCAIVRPLFLVLFW